MKKIIILLLLTFMLSGCYDNVELNNLAIISGLGIDYIDDEFHLTYEVLNDIKTDENTTMKSYTVSGNGKTISDAFTNTNYKVGKKAYFAHLKVVLFSENVINGQLDKINDYLLRDTNIRDEFIGIVTKDVTPEEILKHNSDNNPVVTNLIMNLINNEKYNNNLAIEETYQRTIAKMISKNIDVVLSSITLKNDEISLDNFYIFRGYNYQNTLTKEESTLYNLLTKNVYALEFQKDYNGENVSINISHADQDITVNSNKIKINLNLVGRVLENDANLDLKNKDTYQMLNKDFSKVIQNKVINFVKTLQENKSDILGLEEIYFKKMRKDNQNLWENAEVSVEVFLKINTKGFIFEVENEK